MTPMMLIWVGLLVRARDVSGQKTYRDQGFLPSSRASHYATALLRILAQFVVH
jgi:hypothetical protein